MSLPAGQSIRPYIHLSNGPLFFCPKGGCSAAVNTKQPCLLFSWKIQSVYIYLYKYIESLLTLLSNPLSLRNGSYKTKCTFTTTIMTTVTTTSATTYFVKTVISLYSFTFIHVSLQNALPIGPLVRPLTPFTSVFSRVLRDSISRYVGLSVGRSVVILFFSEFLMVFGRFFCEILFRTISFY